ncbi:GNAT family N-acetyltransferase [Terrimonas alba]|uniref:GNAT family N-acetyltransferase n=1 Tax=Terrimonas alba TaxID=3349636 RepID=UPI0035F32DE4
MKYRPANTKDRQIIYQLYMEESANPFLTYDYMNETDFESLYKKLLKTDTLFVAEENKEIIATYRLISKTDRQAHTVYLGGFTIRKDRQGRGYGKQILDHIKAYLIDSGKSRIELTVDIHNAAAISLYKKAGFEIEGQVRNSYKRSDTGKYYDEYLMGVLL